MATIRLVDYADRAINCLLRLDRFQKRALQLFADLVLLSGSFAFAMLLRLESWEAALDPRAWAVFALSLPLTLAVFIRLGFYLAVIRYISEKALRAVFLGVFASGLSIFLISQIAGQVVPRSVPAIYMVLALVSVGGVRFLLRAIFHRNQFRQKDRLIIYGAGESGRQLLQSLRHSPEYMPMAFVDDNSSLVGSTISGLKVHAPAEIERLAQQYGIKIVLLAMPSASRGERAGILRRLEGLPVHVRTIPGVADMVNGRATINEIRDVCIEDLLGRDPVPANPALLDAKIRGKTVLVSGAGGSIGAELCRQILQQGPRRLCLLENSEFALYTIDQNLRKIARDAGLGTAIVPLLGSVQDKERVEEIFHRFEVQTIFHAAAFKHVPLVEHNIIAGIRNNVFGTLTLARAAVDAGVRDFTLVSTDKAVRPTNVMGASKRLAELICQAMGHEQTGTCFSMVRFGNVLGSSGSVVPYFRRQIAAGGPVTVTDPQITRYFMTIPEAVQLVIQAGAMARGGDVFLLDMGNPVRIADLAAQLIRLSGFKPVFQSADDAPGATVRNDEMLIQFTGLRPGEKLFEELLIDSAAQPTAHEKIVSASELSLPWSELGQYLDALKNACETFDIPEIRAILLRAPVGYQPSSRSVDFLEMARQSEEEHPAEAPLSLVGT